MTLKANFFPVPQWSKKVLVLITYLRELCHLAAKRDRYSFKDSHPFRPDSLAEPSLQIQVFQFISYRLAPQQTALVSDKGRVAL